MEAGKIRLISTLVVLLVYSIALLGVLSFCSPPVSAEISEEVEETPPVVSIPPESEHEVPQEIPPVEITSEEPPIEDGVDELEMPVEDVEVDEPEPIEEEPDPVFIEAWEDEWDDWEDEWDDWEDEWEEWDEDWQDQWIPEEEEDDPWADFYVAGEEDYSIFDDGEYYVPLIVNTDYLSDITVTFLSDSIYVNVAEFRSLISDLLIDSFEQELFATTDTFFSLAYLNEMGIETWYNYQTFELNMNFPTWMMPTRILSINRGTLARYSSYSMSGSSFIEPEPFSWFANLSIYSLLDVSAANNWQINPTSLFTMQSRNSLSIFDVAFDFSYTVHPGRAYNRILETWSEDYRDYVTFQGIQGFYDYKPKSLRFVFGNVNDYLGYSVDTFGIGVEKRYNYGDAKPKNHQFEYEVVVDEPSIVEVLINERSVYRRELQAGIYKLRDFAFTQGANYARVVVEPISNPDQQEEYEFVLGFDSRLLARGDTLYSASLSFPQYNIDNTVFRLNQQYGLNDEVTAQYSLAFSPSAVNLGISQIIATPFGSFDASLSTSYNLPLAFGLAGSLSYRISGSEESSFGALSLSAGITSKRYTTRLSVPPGETPAAGHTITTSFSFSGRVGPQLRYSLSGSLNWLLSSTLPTWRVTLSSGLPLIPRMSVSGSVSLYASPAAPTPQVRGQIGLNYSFNPNLNMSASTNLEDSTYVNASWRPFGSSNSSMQFSFSGIEFDDPLDHQGTISYSRSGVRYGVSLRQQYSDRFTRFTTSLSLNTAFAYSGGMFGMTRSISDNFLLVKPGGAMKGGDIAVTRTMTSEPQALPKLFGVGTYTSITTHQQNNVVVYGIGESLMGSSESFIYDFLPRPRQGYAVRVSSELTYSVVGTLLRTPQSAYSRYTTDLARVEIAEDGEETLVFDETLYLFTDEHGFFFMSGIKAGEYQFSLFLPNSTEDDPPIDVRFTIEEFEDTDEPLVLVLETFIASEISEALEFEFYESLMGNEVESSVFDEDGFYRLEITDRMEELVFWDDYYPQRLMLDSQLVTDGDESFSDSYVEFVGAQPEEMSALMRMRRERELQLFNLARLRMIVKPYLDAISPRDGWKPVTQTSR